MSEPETFFGKAKSTSEDFVLARHIGTDLVAVMPRFQFDQLTDSIIVKDDDGIDAVIPPEALAVAYSAESKRAVFFNAAWVPGKYEPKI